MEKGHMRFDANVSVHKPGTPFGTRVEIKNLNSFRFLRRAIDSEKDRQIQVLENGGTVYQETRLWTGQETAPMRSKEGAADYRYFPDPDLPPLALDPAELAEELRDLPEAPLDLFLLAHDQSVLNAWQTEFGLAEDMVVLLTSDPELAAFFQDAVAAGGDIRAVSNWMQSEILGWVNASNAPLSESALNASHLVVLLRLLDEGVIGRPVAKKLLEEVFATGGDLEALVQERGLARISDESALEDVIRAAIADNPEQAQRYRDGNPKVAGFFMGLVMKATGGRADPAIANRLVREALEK
jgi:aspartyl-tRNA(Asn)/glutamyl-tRNA(Gln) amidotransferase subunit B